MLATGHQLTRLARSASVRSRVGFGVFGLASAIAVPVLPAELVRHPGVPRLRSLPAPACQTQSPSRTP